MKDCKQNITFFWLHFNCLIDFFLGTIGEKEVAIALNRFGVVDGDSAGPQTKAWFNEIDRDNDGLIDQEEFVELMSVAHDMIFSVPSGSFSLFYFSFYSDFGIRCLPLCPL